MGHEFVSRQDTDTEPPTYQDLLEKNEALLTRISELSCVEREKELAIVYVRELEQRIQMLEDQLNYARMGQQRSLADVQELAMLREHKRQWLEIFSVRGITAEDKLVLWALDHKIADSPSRTREDGLTHVFNDDIAAMAGVDKDTVSRSYAKLEAAGTLTRAYEDGKSKLFTGLNQQHMKNPKQHMKPAPNAKKQGGDRRCPQCGQYCKKIVQIGYICAPCGLDFDRDMNPIDHTSLLQVSRGQPSLPVERKEEDEAVKTFTEADLEREEPSKVIQFPLVPATPMYTPRCAKHHTDKQETMSGRWVCPFCEPGRLGYGGTA